LNQDGSVNRMTGLHRRPRRPSHQGSIQSVASLCGKWTIVHIPINGRDRA
jgi:hypothetical protein